jgi:hypothetical protein
LLPTWETHIVLSQQDLDMIHNAVTNQIHGKSVGTAALWSNPASGNSGSIKLGKKLARKSQQYEEIEYTVRAGGTPVYTEHYHFTYYSRGTAPDRPITPAYHRVRQHAPASRGQVPAPALSPVWRRPEVPHPSPP